MSGASLRFLDRDERQERQSFSLLRPRAVWPRSRRWTPPIVQSLVRKLPQDRASCLGAPRGGLGVRVGCWAGMYSARQPFYILAISSTLLSLSTYLHASKVHTWLGWTQKESSVAGGFGFWLFCVALTAAARRYPKDGGYGAGRDPNDASVAEGQYLGQLCAVPASIAPLLRSNPSLRVSLSLVCVHTIPSRQVLPSMWKMYYSPP